MMTHDELALDLAANLRTQDRMVWTDMQMGPLASPRPDVYTLLKSYSNPSPTSYEVKISTSDFRRDATAGKWQLYLKFSCAVYFACEAGLLKKDDIPGQCGLIVKQGSVWRIHKKPIPSVIQQFPFSATMKLLIDGIGREGPLPRYHRRIGQFHDVHAGLGKKLGEQVATYLNNRGNADRDLKTAERQAKSIIEDARKQADLIRGEAEDFSPLRKELCAVLGLRERASISTIRNAIREFKRNLEEHPSVISHRNMTVAINHLLYSHGYKEPKVNNADAAEE